MEKILFIVNPIAGGRKKDLLLKEISRLLDHGKFSEEFIFTTGPGDATEIARGSDAGYIVAVGGDGTVHEVATALAGTEKVMGIIPCGSGNGLARHLGIAATVISPILAINRCKVETIDAGRINGEMFFCTCGIGLDAIVSDKFAKAGTRGLSTYIRKALETWKDFEPETYSIEIDGKRLERKAVLITAGCANQWGNEAKICPGASLRDGLLDLTVIGSFKTAEIPPLAIELMDGRIARNSHVETFRGRRISIERPSAGPAHFDGDPHTLGTRIDMEIVPGCLKVIRGRKRKI